MVGSVCADNSVEMTETAKKIIKGSGLPVPHFVATKGDRINLRAGPGNQYPAKATYIRKYIPLLVIAEFDFWRKVKDIDGEEGWIHKNLLCSNNAVWVKAKVSMLVSHPGSSKKLILKAERGVAGEYLKDQEGDYVRVKFGGYKGWMLRSQVWGVLPKN